MREKISSFNIGDIVFHKKFGVGVVIDNKSNELHWPLVEFVIKNDELHNGEMRGQEGHCWWCNPTKIELLIKKLERRLR